MAQCLCCCLVKFRMASRGQQVWLVWSLGPSGRLVRLASLTCEDPNSTARQGQGSGQQASLGLKRRLERGVQCSGDPAVGRQCGVRWASGDSGTVGCGNFCPSAFISAGRKTKAQNHHITLASPRFAPDRSGRKVSIAWPALRARDSRVSRVCSGQSRVAAETRQPPHWTAPTSKQGIASVSACL